MALMQLTRAKVEPATAQVVADGLRTQTSDRITLAQFASNVTRQAFDCFALIAIRVVWKEFF